jgi:hypothetical protein
MIADSDVHYINGSGASDGTASGPHTPPGREAHP